MSYGLQVLAPAGQTLLELTDRIPRIWSNHSISVNVNPLVPSTAYGFVAVTGMARDGNWMVALGSTSAGAADGLNVWCDTGGFRWNAQYSNSSTFTIAVTVLRLY